MTSSTRKTKTADINHGNGNNSKISSSIQDNNMSSSNGDKTSITSVHSEQTINQHRTMGLNCMFKKWSFKGSSNKNPAAKVELLIVHGCLEHSMIVADITNPIHTCEKQPQQHHPEGRMATLQSSEMQKELTQQ